jgi:hypothetical protein
VGGGLLAALAILSGIAVLLAHRAEPLLRARIVLGLEEHFNSRVELDSFHLSLRDGLWVEGKGLRIWAPSPVPGAPTQGPAAPAVPMIRLDEFRFHAPLQYKPGHVIRISVVQLKGLAVDLPPRSYFEHGVEGQTSTAGKAARSTVAITGSAGPGQDALVAAAKLVRLQVDNLECSGGHLTVETNKPGKPPLEFAIAHLKLTGISADGPLGFEAELTNPRPVGTIHTHGNFGPWVTGDPGESPVSGDYVFEHADLGGFKGIAGILNSTGEYRGTLRNITVDGETETPDFRLTHFGTALPLHTKFHATVDGINGDTWLEPVEATLGQSHFWARGKVVRVAEAGTPGASGHDIALTVTVDRGRMEDFLRLASHSGTPLLTGALTTRAELDIEPGVTSVEERIKLKGTFDLESAQFTSAKIQDRIGDLSARGLGQPKDAKSGIDAGVRSRMKGSFQMAGGVVTLPAIEYTVPGAVIDLNGTYGIENGALNFAGTAKMKATVSAMVGGWKGFLLKPVDRYFEKNGAGTEVPIHIDGTREDPHFGIDFNRLKKTSAQRPGESQ